MPRYEAKKEQKNPNGFRKSIDGSHYYRIGWDSIKAIKLLPNPQKKKLSVYFQLLKNPEGFHIVAFVLLLFFILSFRFFFFTIFDDEGPRSDEGWILPPHSKRFNHITSKELDKNRQTLRLVCVCEQQILLCFFEKKKSRIHVRCQQTYCVYHSNFFSHPPPPLACLSAGRLDFGDGWFVKKHRQVTLLFSYVLADSRTFLIPPCATHENPFPLKAYRCNWLGLFFFFLFFPFPSSFIFYSMVAGWIYNNGFSPTNRKEKKNPSIHRRCCAYRVSNPSFAFSFFL